MPIAPKTRSLLIATLLSAPILVGACEGATGSGESVNDLTTPAQTPYDNTADGGIYAFTINDGKCEGLNAGVWVKAETYDVSPNDCPFTPAAAAANCPSGQAFASVDKRSTTDAKAGPEYGCVPVPPAVVASASVPQLVINAANSFRSVLFSGDPTQIGSYVNGASARAQANGVLAKAATANGLVSANLVFPLSSMDKSDFDMAQRVASALASEPATIRSAFNSNGRLISATPLGANNWSFTYAATYTVSEPIEPSNQRFYGRDPTTIAQSELHYNATFLEQRPFAVTVSNGVVTGLLANLDASSPAPSLTAPTLTIGTTPPAPPPTPSSTAGQGFAPAGSPMPSPPAASGPAATMTISTTTLAAPL